MRRDIDGDLERPDKLGRLLLSHVGQQIAGHPLAAENNPPLRHVVGVSVGRERASGIRRRLRHSIFRMCVPRSAQLALVCCLCRLVAVSPLASYLPLSVPFKLE